MTTRRISSVTLLFAAGWAALAGAAAQAANPSLMAYDRGIEDPARHSQALQIAALDMRVNVVGALADVTVTVKFSNPGDETLEGRFTLDLPPGAVVTGYALDVENTMIDGVLVDPLKARRAYQQRVRAGVDPGIAAVSRANQFSTSIYPIPSASSRTIRLRFSAPIHSLQGLVIPLATAKPVGRFALEVHASAVTAAPALTLPSGLSAEWRAAGNGFAASVSVAGKPLAGQLRIAPVAPTSKGLITRHANGKRLFQISDSFAARVKESEPAGQRLRVYWDRSLSRRDDRLKDELSLLDQYITQSKIASIDLVIFNSSGARVRRVAPAEVAGILRGVLYRGATSFAVLEKLEAPIADTCLVFSDGVVTLDARHDFNPGCRVSAIASAPDADAGFLARLTRPSGGAVFRLDRQSESETLLALRDPAPRVIEAHGEDGSALRFASVDAGAGGWIVVGEAPKAGGVVLRVAGLDKGIVERRYELAPARTERFAGAGALWAADRVGLLGAEDGASRALLALSRQFSVASPALSFIVLEQPSDYLEAGIAPPANYPKDLMEEYLSGKAEGDVSPREIAETRLAEVIEQWEEQKQWWNRDFTSLPKKIAADAGAGPPAARAAPSPAVGEMMLEEVSVTGFRASSSALGNADSYIDTAMEEWSLDRPYLKALDKASPAELDRVLAREESRNGTLPAFYFDVAEWLHRKDRPGEAVEMLVSALDLPVANEETASMVADRLLRYGRIERAIWLYERAYQQSDYLPQTRRTLALALAKRAVSAKPAAARADLRRAIGLLNEIVMYSWDEAYDGIEMVALMEANELLPKLKALGERDIPLDPRLRALLDLDIRVVIEWNTAATDMDLWVDEPTGERAIYNHPRTGIGGRLSNDMTAGFGPEEYMLRRAIPGEYRISVNVYASDVINPNGTTVVTAHLLRNFGRANQHEETMELELAPDDSGEKLIGRFTVK
jgi:hypothetical protein